jgi:hypothetical protein
MAVETFTRADFEAALPKHKVTGEPLCKCLGVVSGEYTYLLPVSDKVGVMIRSSVKSDGVSAGVGEDSIRLWLVDPSNDNAPLSSKVTRWIARTGAWRVRVVEQARTLYGLGKRLGACPDCGKALALRKVKKEGPNKGKLFFSCDCGHFAWAE